MRTRLHRALAVVVMAAVLSAPMRVGAGTWTGGASEWTQISNNIQLIMHTVSLIQTVVNLGKQLALQIKMAATQKSPEAFLQLMGGVGGLITQMRGLLFQSESIVSRWEKTHQGSQNPNNIYESPSEAYRKIDESTRQAVKRAMDVLELQSNSADGWPKDQDILKQLSEKAHSADGEVKCLQVALDLLLEIIRQLHLLRGVQIAHAEMMGYHVSGETQRRQFEDKYLRDQRLGYTGRYRATRTVDPSRANMGFGGGFLGGLLGGGGSVPSATPTAGGTGGGGASAPGGTGGASGVLRNGPGAAPPPGSTTNTGSVLGSGPGAAPPPSSSDGGALWN